MAQEFYSAVILAAGSGTRLYPLTKDAPKCMTRLGDRSIVENALEALADYGVKEVFIVVGYLHQTLESFIGNEFKGMKIEYVLNSIYAETNSMYSLMLGLSQCDIRKGDVLILEGDVYFSPNVLDFNFIGDVCWLVDSSLKVEGAQLTVDSKMRIKDLSIIRDIALLKSTHYKSAGIVAAKKETILCMIEWLKNACIENKKNLYYDLILAEHFDEANFHAVDLSGRKWYEIDNVEDLEIAKKMFSGGISVQDFFNTSFLVQSNEGGCCSFGGGGLVEYSYRVFFENRTLLSLLKSKITTQSIMLELGGGCGRNGFALAPLLKEYFSFDFSEEATAIARKQALLLQQENLHFSNQDIRSFKHQSSVDIIFCAGVIQYLSDDELDALLKKIFRILKPDGLLLDRSTVSLEEEDWSVKTDNYYSIYRTPQKIKTMFEKAGFIFIEHKNSYRFLRCPFLWNHRLRNEMKKIIDRLSPVSFWGMWFFSCFMDIIKPRVLREQGKSYSHDFLLFRKR